MLAYWFLNIIILSVNSFYRRDLYRLSVLSILVILIVGFDPNKCVNSLSDQIVILM